jgi:NAD(P)-dependent dehydrogenase (short-subunit alcohol dehydrogenase family)
MWLENRVSLITGGASGIGRAAALVFAREGARLVIADVDLSGGEETVALVKQRGGEALFVCCDVARAAEVEQLIQEVVMTFGRLDCAFNNAGVDGDTAPTAECTEENWDKTLAVNLKGVWLCMKYEIQQMLKQGSGAIVNTASVAGLVAERGLPAYAAAKGGVIQLTRTAAVEYASAHIRVNALCPGAVDTPMLRRSAAQKRLANMNPGAPVPPLVERLVDAAIGSPLVQKGMLSFLQPMGRVGRPEEIAEAAVWLCSDAASFVTGHAFPVDGGLTAQ